MEFKIKLKTLRKEKHLTQIELAEKLGIPVKSLINWEQGRTNPNLESLANLLDFFGVPASYLIGDEPTKEPKQPTEKDIFGDFSEPELRTLTDGQRNALCFVAAQFVQSNKKVDK